MMSQRNKEKKKKISFATSPSVEEANCIDVMIWVDPTTNRHSERIEKNNVPCPRGNIRSFQIVVGFKDAHTILYSNIPMYIQSWWINHKNSKRTGPPVKILNGFQKWEWRNPFINVHHFNLNGRVIIKLFKWNWTRAKRRQIWQSVCKDCKSKITKKSEEVGFRCKHEESLLILYLHRETEV
jgi:hypothetical protein